MDRNLPNNQGRLAVVSGSVPAAGNSPSLTQPVGCRWRVLGLQTTLTTDANVATRVPKAQIIPALGIGFEFPVNGGIALALTRVISWGAGVNPPVVAGSTAITGCIPAEAFLNGAATINLITDNIQVGDQYTALSAWVEEWIEPA